MLAVRRQVATLGNATRQGSEGGLYEPRAIREAIITKNKQKNLPEPKSEAFSLTTTRNRILSTTT